MELAARCNPDACDYAKMAVEKRDGLRIVHMVRGSPDTNDVEYP